MLTRFTFKVHLDIPGDTLATDVKNLVEDVKKHLSESKFVQGVAVSAQVYPGTPIKPLKDIR